LTIDGGAETAVAVGQLASDPAPCPSLRPYGRWVRGLGRRLQPRPLHCRV